MKQRHRWPPSSSARRFTDSPRIPSTAAPTAHSAPQAQHRLVPPTGASQMFVPECHVPLRVADRVVVEYSESLESQKKSFQEFMDSVKNVHNIVEKDHLHKDLCDCIREYDLPAEVNVWNVETHGMYPTNHCDEEHLETRWFSDVREEKDFKKLRRSMREQIQNMIVRKKTFVEILILNAFFDHQRIDSARTVDHPGQLMLWKERVILAVKMPYEETCRKRKVGDTDWEVEHMGHDLKRTMMTIDE
jgi:hypothetical protein